MNPEKIYPRSQDRETIYLKAAITRPDIQVGDHTIYNDFVHDPLEFESRNVLYHYPVNHNVLRIGKFCSIACGARFLFTSANHSLSSLSTYPFPIFFEEWGLDKKELLERFRVDFDTTFFEAVKELDDKCYINSENSFSLTEEGWMILDSIILSLSLAL